MPIKSANRIAQQFITDKRHQYETLVADIGKERVELLLQLHEFLAEPGTAIDDANAFDLMARRDRDTIRAADEQHAQKIEIHAKNIDEIVAMFRAAADRFQATGIDLH